MAKAKKSRTAATGRVKLTGKECLKRMREFTKRKEPFIAAIREGKDRSIPA